MPPGVTLEGSAAGCPGEGRLRNALITVLAHTPPLSLSFLQTINDWYDREIDAINEPYRPIPSGGCAWHDAGATTCDSAAGIKPDGEQAVFCYSG